MNRNLLLIIFICFTSLLVNAQSTLGEIRGKIIDAKTKKPLDYVSVTITNSKDKIVAQVLSNDDGSFTIRLLSPDEYNVKAAGVGYASSIVKHVRVSADQITFQNVSMEGGGAFYCTDICYTSVPISRAAPALKDSLSPYITLQKQYCVEANHTFNCVLTHKSREIENKLKQQSIKLFNEVAAFPNPTNGILNIESMYDGNKTITICDMTGAQHYSGTIVHHLQLDVTTFPKGIYIITVTDKENDEKTFQKFVVCN